MNVIRGNLVGTNQRPENVLVRATELTEEQKAQARANIGAASVDQIGSGSGSVNLDTTLTKSGQAADAKAVGDKLGPIESTLDSIIAIQNSLIGGDGA